MYVHVTLGKGLRCFKGSNKGGLMSDIGKKVEQWEEINVLNHKGEESRSLWIKDVS